MEYLNFRAMNSEILLAAEGSQAQVGFELARDYIEQSERRFTRFSQDSELARLNRAAGSWMTVSSEMFELLEIALDCFQTTQGLFDPTILGDLEKAGYTKNMDELRLSGAEALSNPGLRAVRLAFDSLELRSRDLSILLPPGMRIDLGGIAKGWIAEQAARRLAQFTSACCVNAGGDLFLIGTPDEMTAWEVGLEDPRHPGLDLIVLQVDGGAVTTSSVAKRVWQQGSATRHHLIDPRTGEPAVTPWLSVTVLAPGAAQAEVFAKAFLVGGPIIARELIEKNPQITYLAVGPDGKIWIPEDGQIVELIIES